MDRVLNSRDEKQTIYEIYRACRLCGAGAGYKMPIIQNVVNLDGDGVELRHKIKECVQIEVNHTDRMPPLICELCVDKVNDFYEFLDMCKQNNKRTRLRLGLPLRTPTRDSAESDNCILGVTEPVFIHSDAETLNRNKSKKNKVKKEPVEVKIKTENNRPSPKPEPKPTPQPRRESSEDGRWAVMSRGRAGPQPGPGGPPGPRRATRQSVEPVLTPPEDVLVLERKLKRARENETKNDTPPPSKKIKTIPEPLKTPVIKPKAALKEQPKPKSQPKPASKKEIKPSPPPKPTPKPPSKPPSKPLHSKPTPKPQPSKSLHSKSKPLKVTPEVPKNITCSICNAQIKTSQGLFQHNNSKHVPAFTSPKHACNACELWFLTTEEAANHHKNHRTQNVPYKCTRCYGYFKLQLAYQEHFGLGQCLSEWEVPDARCGVCWRTFPTGRLLEEHRCAGEDGRPGGKCKKCKRSYALLKNLVKHESTCTYRRKGEMPGLLPMQVRVARCDPLLAAGAPVRCGALPQNYGLDRSCQYPYFRPRVKTEHPMVAIHESVKNEFSTLYRVESLSSLCIRSLQAKERVKDEPFEQFDDISAKVNSIIDHLANEDSQSCGSDSILNIESKREVKDKLHLISLNFESNNDDDKDKDTPMEVETKTNRERGEAMDKLPLVSLNCESNNDDKGDTPKECEEAVETKTSVDNEVKEIDDKLVLNEPCNVISDSVSVDESENVGNSNNVIDSLNDKVTDSFDVRNDVITNTKENEQKEVENENNDKELEVSEKNETELVSEKISDSLTDESSKNGNVDSEIESKIENELVNNTHDNQHEVENKEVGTDSDEKTDKTVSNVNFSKIDEITNKINDNEHEVDENKEVSTDSDLKTENNVNFSKIDEITNKILENQESNANNDSKDNSNEEISNEILDNQESNVSNTQDSVLQDQNSDSRPGENGRDIQDKFNVNDLSEDDRKLMAELDEQIGENEQKSCDNPICENDKEFSENDELIGENDKEISENDNQIGENDEQIGQNDKQISVNDHKIIENSQNSRSHYIDELIKKQNSEMRSLDLDNISDDEFNFDI